MERRGRRRPTRRRRRQRRKAEGEEEEKKKVLELARCQGTLAGRDCTFYPQLLYQCGSMSNCPSRSAPEVHVACWWGRYARKEQTDRQTDRQTDAADGLSQNDGSQSRRRTYGPLCVTVFGQVGVWHYCP